MSGNGPNINDPKQWGPKIPSHNHTFKVGDIFILDVYGNADDIGVYRARKDWDPSHSGRELFLERLDSSGWDTGYSWDMSHYQTFIQVWQSNVNVADDRTFGKVDASDWRAWAHNQPGNCPCGISREQCEYH